MFKPNAAAVGAVALGSGEQGEKKFEASAAAAAAAAAHDDEYSPYFGVLAAIEEAALALGGTE